MQIPMPGHLANEKMLEKVMQDVETIEQLVQEHDACFQLFDSREARWFPTLQSALHNKICISVGLGFDSYVIMRHGVSPFVHNKDKDPERSGNPLFPLTLLQVASSVMITCRQRTP